MSVAGAVICTGLMLCLLSVPLFASIRPSRTYHAEELFRFWAWVALIAGVLCVIASAWVEALS